MSEDKRQFAKHQPRDGETILHCGHPDVRPQHFYSFGPNAPQVNWKLDDGREILTRFMVLCEACNQTKGFTPHLAIRGHAEWKGHEPVIRENIQ